MADLLTSQARFSASLRLVSFHFPLMLGIDPRTWSSLAFLSLNQMLEGGLSTPAEARGHPVLRDLRGFPSVFSLQLLPPVRVDGALLCTCPGHSQVLAWIPGYPTPRDGVGKHAQAESQAYMRLISFLKDRSPMLLGAQCLKTVVPHVLCSITIILGRKVSRYLLFCCGRGRITFDLLTQDYLPK